MKWWQSTLSSIATHIVAIGLGILIGKFIWTTKTEIIDLTKQQKKQIIQEARLGWITLDSAKALIKQESEIKWIFKDSIVIKDSLNIKDSVITVYVPVYEAEDSLIVLLDSLEYLIEVGLKQRFFPLQERFASFLWLNKFQIPVMKSLSERIYKHFALGIGMGTRFNEHYLFGNMVYKLFNSSWFEMPIIWKIEYSKEKEISNIIETKLQVKF